LAPLLDKDQSQDNSAFGASYGQVALAKYQSLNTIRAKVQCPNTRT